MFVIGLFEIDECVCIYLENILCTFFLCITLFYAVFIYAVILWKYAQNQQSDVQLLYSPRAALPEQYGFGFVLD